MISLFNYIVESSLLLALLMLFYQLVLSREKCITYNRFYLLGASLLSALLPLLNFPLVQISRNQLMLDQVYEIPAIVSQITTFSEPKNQGFESFVQVLSLVYLTGCLVMLLLFFVKLYQLIKLIKESNPITKNRYKVILTNGKLPSFSFGNYLFLNQLNKSENELKAIIKHEEAHIEQKHSYDILIVELYKIFFWFNPLSYRLSKAIKLNHEFLADRFAIQSTNQKSYIEALIKQVYRNTVSPVVHYFGLHSTEKRINMIRQNINLGTLYKPYFVIPFLSVLVFTFSCHFQPDNILPTTIGETFAPKQFESKMENLKGMHPERSYFFKFVSSPELEKIKARDYDQYSIDLLAKINGNSGVFGMIYSFDKSRNLPNVFFSKKIYTVEELTEVPTPWNGYEALLESIDKHANELVSVKKDKVIWVKFIVNTFGEVVHTNIADSDYSNMSEADAGEYGAAIKAITATSNQWRIGKINNTLVNVEMELPVQLNKVN
ncbi:MAG: M56 family metallopeptidase [Cyclobacteriaceae bacterium]|nr:M56 family metallopeptidase [Cyclobacteriaceae bacterium]